jgi:hypothetical protein
VSMLGAWLARRQRDRARLERTSRVDPAACSSVEDYAYRLMWAGVETEEARELIRAALDRQCREAEADWEHVQRRRQATDRYEARREAAALAAGKLLREAGYTDLDGESELLPPLPPATGPQMLGRWVPEFDRLDPTLDHDPLLDGPVSG